MICLWEVFHQVTLSFKFRPRALSRPENSTLCFLTYTSQVIGVSTIVPRDRRPKG